MEAITWQSVLRALREKTKSEYGTSLTDYRIIDEFKREDIPDDLHDLLRSLRRIDAC